MTALEVVDYLADPRPLRRKARQVRAEEIYTDPFCRFVQDLKDTLQHYNALGLAATQVRPTAPDGEPWSLFLMRDLASQNVHVFVNPVITTSGTAIASSEGCLSFRSVQWQMRCKPISAFKGCDDDWKPINLQVHRLTPLEVACLQHETDHLSGKLMTDRMNHADKEAFMRKVGKAERLPAPPPPAPLPEAVQALLK